MLSAVPETQHTQAGSAEFAWNADLSTFYLITSFGDEKVGFHFKCVPHSKAVLTREGSTDSTTQRMHFWQRVWLVSVVNYTLLSQYTCSPATTACQDESCQLSLMGGGELRMFHVKIGKNLTSWLLLKAEIALREDLENQSQKRTVLWGLLDRKSSLDDVLIDPAKGVWKTC